MRTIIAIILIWTVSIGAACSGNANNQNSGRGNRSTSGNQNGVNGEAEVSRTPTPTPEAGDEKLRKLVADLGTALARGDADALEQIYSDGYIHISDNGQLFTKADLLVGVKSGTVKFDSVNLEDVSIRVYDDSAIIIATFVGTSGVSGRKININDRVTMVARRENDQWRLVSSQMTGIQAASATGNSRSASESGPNPKVGGTGTNGNSRSPAGNGNPDPGGSTGNR